MWLVLDLVVHVLDQIYSQFSQYILHVIGHWTVDSTATTAGWVVTNAQSKVFHPGRTTLAPLMTDHKVMNTFKFQTISILLLTSLLNWCHCELEKVEYTVHQNQCNACAVHQRCTDDDGFFLSLSLSLSLYIYIYNWPTYDDDVFILHCTVIGPTYGGSTSSECTSQDIHISCTGIRSFVVVQ